VEAGIKVNVFCLPGQLALAIYGVFNKKSIR